MNIGDLLGAVMQSGMAPSSNQRLKNAVGGGGLLESLGGLLGGQQGGGGGLGDVLGSVLGGGGGQGGSGGPGGMLGEILNQAGQAAGGKQNIALGGLGALVGSILGGGGKSMSGALGGGIMALLGAMAMKALQGSRQGAQQVVPVGLLEPQTEDDQRELEQHSELVLKAMINAAKADGQIDAEEIQRIVGKLQEMGADAEAQRYVQDLMQQPLQTEGLIAAAQGRPELAAQMYAASLMAIEVDTAAEKAYLEHLASGLALPPEVTQRIAQMVGLQYA